MQIPRRIFLESSLITLFTTLLPRWLLAEWLPSAFTAKSIEEALQTVFATSITEVSEQITIDANDTAEDGEIVNIAVKTSLSEVQSIAILVEKNRIPLNAKFDFADNFAGFVATRIKMGKTSPVIAVVKSGDKLYTASKEIKVIVGGCGCS